MPTAVLDLTALHHIVQEKIESFPVGPERKQGSVSFPVSLVNAS